jgi:hypothetical protein
MNGFIRGCGRSLLLGGALTILVNVVATPLLPGHQGPAVVCFREGPRSRRWQA